MFLFLIFQLYQLLSVLCPPDGRFEPTFGATYIITPTDLLKTLLDYFGIAQYVDFSTRRKEHILDLVYCTGKTPYNPSAAELPTCLPV